MNCPTLNVSFTACWRRMIRTPALATIWAVMAATGVATNRAMTRGISLRENEWASLRNRKWKTARSAMANSATSRIHGIETPSRTEPHGATTRVSSAPTNHIEPMRTQTRLARFPGRLALTLDAVVSVELLDVARSISAVISDL